MARNAAEMISARLAKKRAFTMTAFFGGVNAGIGKGVLNAEALLSWWVIWTIAARVRSGVLGWSIGRLVVTKAERKAANKPVYEGISIVVGYGE